LSKSSNVVGDVLMTLRSSRPGHGRRAAAVGTVALGAALVLAGCTSPSSGGGGASSSSSGSSSSSSASSTAGAQQVAGSNGPTCTISTYGATKGNLKGMTVGFSQSESTSNPFRATETKSITEGAAAAGVKLIQRNANANVAQQNTDVQDMIAAGAKALIIAPENSNGLAPSLAQAKAKHIPVLTIDRTVTGKACSDFIGFIGSDFAGQAKIAADDMGAAMGGKGEVAILQGTSGNNVAQARTSGFTKELSAKYPNIKVVASQTANFDQATGQKVTEQILQSNPKLSGLYAENDGMALGAIQAMTAASKKPGKDIKIVSIDGIQQLVQNVAKGTVVSDIETNPRFGPLAFQTLSNFFAGKPVPETVIIKDHHFTSGNAKAALTNGDVY
jgi:ribose transport system substrate-binding protein